MKVADKSVVVTGGACSGRCQGVVPVANTAMR